MAQRRMFSLKIVDTDAFMEMPISSQLLYFHLAMRADDEGFVANPKRIQKTLGSGDDDYKVLVAKKFVLEFNSGVCVIKHWLIHNAIRTNRFNPTTYQRELAELRIKDNKAYTKGEDGIPVVNQRLTIVPAIVPASGMALLNLTKLNLTKLNKEETKNKYGEFENVLLSDIEYEKLVSRFNESNTKLLIESLSTGIASKGYKYKNHYAALLNWARREIKNYQEKESTKRRIV